MEEIPSLLKFGKIKPKKSKNLCIMHKHGSLAAKDVITLEKKAKEETRPRANTGIEFG